MRVRVCLPGSPSSCWYASCHVNCIFKHYRTTPYSVLDGGAGQTRLVDCERHAVVCPDSNRTNSIGDAVFSWITLHISVEHRLLAPQARWQRRRSRMTVHVPPSLTQRRSDGTGISIPQVVAGPAPRYWPSSPPPWSMSLRHARIESVAVSKERGEPRAVSHLRSI